MPRRLKAKDSPLVGQVVDLVDPRIPSATQLAAERLAGASPADLATRYGIALSTVYRKLDAAAKSRAADFARDTLYREVVIHAVEAIRDQVRAGDGTLALQLLTKLDILGNRLELVTANPLDAIRQQLGEDTAAGSVSSAELSDDL